MRSNDDDDEEGFGPPPDPSVRAWRHPSEIASAEAAAARFAADDERRAAWAAPPSPTGVPTRPLAGLVLGVVFTLNIEEVRQGVMWLSGRTVFDPNFYYLPRMPAAMDPFETGMIVLMALLLSIVATLYPSWRASRLDPVEALRYE